MKKEELKLCFIKKLYSDKKDNNVFRFYFTSKIDDVTGENWDLPCADTVSPPYKTYIDHYYDLETSKINFELLEENDFFTYNDSTYGIVSLAWEYAEDDHYSNTKIVFHFGETIKEVENKLYERELANFIIDDDEEEDED